VVVVCVDTGIVAGYYLNYSIAGPDRARRPRHELRERLPVRLSVTGTHVQ
jgi:hypothetical protein